MIVYSVIELTRHIKALLDADDALADCAVEGEVSGSKLASSGHFYFTLKDSEAELKCVMWRSQASRTTLPQQGERIRATGYVSVYERGGAYQFYASTLQAVGDGDLWRQFLELRDRLRAEGLFDEALKRPLPAWVRRIGVVTSETGAAFQDILNVLAARWPLAEVVLSPSLVQGSAAPAALVRALRNVERYGNVDVIIVARGGGSIEDLWAFNDESLARAVAACEIPVVTGVGHETDFTIVDFVADYRAPTPSAAAAAVVPDIGEVAGRVATMAERLCSLVEEGLYRRRERLAGLQRLLEQHSPVRRVAEFTQRVDEMAHRMSVTIRHALRVQRMRVEASADRLTALDPRLVLGRGYAIVRDRETGRVLSNAAHTAVDRDLVIRLHRGQLAARVRRVVPCGQDTEGGQT